MPKIDFEPLDQTAKTSDRSSWLLLIMLMASPVLLLSCEDQSTPAQQNEESDQEVGGIPAQDEADLSVNHNDQEMAGDEAVTESGEEAGSPAGDNSLGAMEAGGGSPDMVEGGMSAPTAGSEERMPSCLLSCAEFVECAIKQCPGYDQTDDALLMEECLGLCNPNLARLFDQLTGCPEKIRFASTVRTDFLNFCDSVTAGYCETYVATCGEWLGTADCEEQYNSAPRTGDDYTSGAHQQCYEYHLGSAQRALEEGDEVRVRESCERAAGLNTCIDN